MGISYETFYYLARLVPPEKLPDPNTKEEDRITYKIPSISIRNSIIEMKIEHLKW